MKFERTKTEKSRKRLKRVFYFTFLIFIFSGILKLSKVYFGVDLGLVTSSIIYLSILSFLVLFVVYVIHIIIEGLEKPKFVPTKTKQDEKT